MTKVKSGESTVICADCKREQTSNICEIHIAGKNPCYYCHLTKEHIFEYVPEKEDTTPAKIESKKGNINDIFKDDTKKVEKPFKTLKEMRDETNKAIEKNKKEDKKSKNDKKDDDDDRGIYS